MNYFLKTTVLAAAMTATSLACLPAADAQNYTYYPTYDLYTLPNGSLAVNPAAVAGSTYGITAPAYGAYGITAPAYGMTARTYGITAPTLGTTNYSSQSYISPVPVYTSRYGVTAVGLLPRSPQWYAYCHNRYRTFDPSSGTFIGYDGLQHFCAG